MKIVSQLFDLPEGVHLPDARVPITLDFDCSQTIGFATLRRDDEGRVYVDAELTDESVCSDLRAGWRGDELLTVGCVRKGR